MNNTFINGELSVCCPDGFSVMEEAELKRFFTETQNRWGIYNKDIHTIISFSKTKDSTLLSFITDAKAVAKGLEARHKTSLQNYRHKDEGSAAVLQNKAYTISFTYTADDADVTQCGKLTVFKFGKCFYTVHCTVREDYASQGYQALEAVLDSLKKEQK